MKRTLSMALLLLGMYALAERPAVAQDWVYYVKSDSREEPKDSPLNGKIKSETPGGVVITVGKADRTIPALDVAQVGYTVNGLKPAAFRGAYANADRALKLDSKTKAKERNELFAKALKAFNELLPDVRSNPAASRYVQYRIADLEYLMAMDDPTQRPKAIKVLEDYAAANPGGWEILPTLKTIARLHEEGGELEKARGALERLADLPDVPRDIQRASNVAVSQMLMRAKRFPEAEKRLSSLLDKIPPGDPQRASTQVYIVQAQVAQKKTEGAEKQLKDSIAASSDPVLRGMAYNTLGDLYRAKGQTEDAFWAYLRVDTMYNVEPNEHAKAIYYLSQLFKEKKFGDRTGDPIRANNYREKLLDKRFADSEFQKLVSK